MKQMKKMWMIVGGSVLLLLSMLVGAFFAGPLIASAQSTNNTATKPAAQSNPYCDLYNQTLAKNLGVSTSTLSQDRQSARQTVLNQMVKDGKLTQAQATAIEQKSAKKQTCASFNAQNIELRVVHQYLNKNHVDLLNQIAQGLNTKSSDLTAQLKSGKSLNDIATAQHVTQAALQSLLQTAINNEISKGESSNALTKDQVTAFQQYMTNHPKLLTRLANKHWHAKKA